MNIFVLIVLFIVLLIIVSFIASKFLQFIMYAIINLVLLYILLYLFYVQHKQYFQHMEKAMACQICVQQSVHQTTSGSDTTVDIFLAKISKMLPQIFPILASFENLATDEHSNKKDQL